MKLIYKSISFFILTVFFTNDVFAQTIIPILEEVSIVGNSGNVKLKWRHETPSNVYIFRDSIEIGAYKLIDSVKNTSILEYIDTKANATNKNRQYILRSTAQGSNSKKFPTQLLSFTYDSCKAEIYLNWTNSIVGFPSLPDVNFIRYEIYLKENASSYQKIGETTDKNYTVNNIKEKTNYSFYIAAIPEHAPDSKSTANTLSFYSEMAQPPAYINTQSASVSNGIVNLGFIVDSDSELTRYALLRSKSLNGTYDTIQPFETTEKSISRYDTKANTEKYVYYYKLVALNNCNIPVLESDIINTILLKAENNDKISTLSWNAFKESTSPLCNYRIFRIHGNDAPLQIATLFEEYTYEDNIEDLVGGDSEICYFVNSWESLGTAKNNFSNSACVYLEPKIIIPDAFIPNSSIKDRDKFYIYFSFIPKDYKIIIYNRWSNVVFETTDPQKSWDGRSLNGSPVPAGGYIYYLKIVTDTKQTIEKRGNITVIYP